MFFDYNDDDFGYQLSNDIGMDSEGNLMMKSGDNMAINLSTGELHIVSGWDNDEDE